MIDISDIHFHDTGILRVVEDTVAHTLIIDVEYPVNWEENKFEKRRLVFTDAYGYQVHEGPFVGSPTILGASVVGEDNGWTRIRLQTNAGFREVHCKAMDLMES